MKPSIDEFKKDLLSLMEKHKIHCIGFNVGEGSDLCGLWDERISFEDALGNEVFSVYGYSIDRGHLK